jgi:hypothetical protein
MEAVETWLSSQTTDFFDTDIQNFNLRYDKFLSFEGDYMRKVSSVYTYIFLYIMNVFLDVCSVNSSPEVTFRTALVI